MGKQWFGTIPAQCDLCKQPIKDVFIDGATKMGCWANMCPSCHRNRGHGLGTGRGQKYQRKLVDGKEVWVKIAG